MLNFPHSLIHMVYTFITKFWGLFLEMMTFYNSCHSLVTSNSCYSHFIVVRPVVNMPLKVVDNTSNWQFKDKQLKPEFKLRACICTALFSMSEAGLVCQL